MSEDSVIADSETSVERTACSKKELTGKLANRQTG